MKDQFFEKLAEKIYESEIKWSTLIDFVKTNDKDRVVSLIKEYQSKLDLLESVDDKIEMLYQVAEKSKNKTRKTNYEGYVEISKCLYDFDFSDNIINKAGLGEQLIEAKKNLLGVILDEEKEIKTIKEARNNIQSYDAWLQKILDKSEKEYNNKEFEIWAKVYGIGMGFSDLLWANTFTLMRLVNKRKTAKVKAKIKRIEEALQNQIDSAKKMQDNLKIQLDMDIDWSDIDKELEDLKRREKPKKE